jgi:methyl-accepting chemotaxis protein
MNLVSALQKHLDWKIIFRNTISEQGEMDAVTIAKDNYCELGKWLHGEGKNECSAFPGYAVTLAKHAEFHIEAGKIASAINEKKFTEAEAMLDGDSAFNTVSDEVGEAILFLKIETLGL